MQWMSDVMMFLQKHCFPIGRRLQDCDSQVNDQQLISIGRSLKELSKSMIHPATISAGHGDHRLLRAQIQLEETGELLMSLGRKDQVETLDAICDMIYASIGTAMTYGLPLAQGFELIHRSNMTKPPSKDPRLKDKGSPYQDPGLESLF